MPWPLLLFLQNVKRNVRERERERPRKKAREFRQALCRQGASAGYDDARKKRKKRKKVALSLSWIERCDLRKKRNKRNKVRLSRHWPGSAQREQHRKGCSRPLDSHELRSVTPISIEVFQKSLQVRKLEIFLERPSALLAVPEPPSQAFTPCEYYRGARARRWPAAPSLPPLASCRA
jgi:hypothetical protein